MAPTGKDSEVLTASPDTGSAVSSAVRPRFDETGTASRPQPVALEVPVTVNGARTVDGSDKREPFSETTKTVLVFGNGAVIRLGSPVAAGQLLFLTNEKTKKEVVCQVVKSKNYKSVSGYVELEFTESVVGFWGMRFPSDRVGTPVPVASAPTPISSIPAVPKGNVIAPVVASGASSPSVSPTARIPEVKPAQVPAPTIQAAQIHAETKPVPQAGPGAVSVVPPPTAVSKPQVVQTPVTVDPPAARKPEAPVVATPAASSLASSLASLLGAPDVPATVAPKPSAPVIPAQDKPRLPGVAADSSTEELKVQAARLQEQLSSLLFSSAPVAPAGDPGAVVGSAAQVLEIAKSAPPAKTAVPTKPLSAPIKSSLDTEEVKIPSWLEPLARNAAAAPPALEPAESEKNKQPIETIHEAHAAEPLPLTALESVPESTLPTIGNLLPLDEPVISEQRSSGSGKGVLFGAIAAGILLAAGGAWYFLRPANAVQGTSAPVVSAPIASAPVTSAPTSPANTPSSTPFLTAPAQPVSQPAASAANSGAPASSLTGAKSAPNSQPAPVTRDNTRGAATTIPAAATERISRPPADPAPAPAPKKPALGEVHLASPTMNRTAAAQDNGSEAPAISSGNDGIAGGLSSGLVVGTSKQPAAPEVPLPVGGDVRTAKLIGSVSPVYPAMAKTQHVSGDVRVDALIDANGRVTTMKVISGPALLHQSAMEALRQWKYQPATLDGKAVPMHLTVTIQFRLQ